MESRDVIRNRMLKEAARIWGYSESEMNADAFDPIVSLLLGSMATEMERIGNDIDDAEKRVVGNLIQQLTPDALTSALPAYALMQVLPVEPVYTLKPDHQFLFKSPNPDDKRELYFTPLRDFQIMDARIEMMVGGNIGWQIGLEGSKKRFFEAENLHVLPQNQLWLGIKIGENVSEIDQIPLFFDWKLDSRRDDFLRMLPHSSVFFNQNEHETTAGFVENDAENLRSEKDFFHLKKEFDVQYRIQQLVESAFSEKIRTIFGPFDFSQKMIFPPVFADVFAENDLKKLKDALVWVRVDFPNYAPAAIFENLHCLLNPVPIINRKHYKRIIKTEENFSIVPLVNEEFFLGIHVVQNSQGREIEAISNFEEGEEKPTHYLVRDGGLARTDARSAAEMVTYLLHYLREDAAAFSGLGLDLFSGDLRTLRETINRLEKGAQKSTGLRTAFPHLLLRSEKANEQVRVEYWSTHGAQANKLPAGAKLDAIGGLILSRDSTVLLTSTRGGRGKLAAKDSGLEYKKALMSRGRVVTNEDIRLYCQAFLGDKIKTIEIKKGISLDADPAKGIVRTLDILLKPADNQAQNLADWADLREDLRMNLQSNSASMYPIRVELV
jgi:hypothetical protein